MFEDLSPSPQLNSRPAKPTYFFFQSAVFHRVNFEYIHQYWVGKNTKFVQFCKI